MPPSGASSTGLAIDVLFLFHITQPGRVAILVKAMPGFFRPSRAAEQSSLARGSLGAHRQEKPRRSLRSRRGGFEPQAHPVPEQDHRLSFGCVSGHCPMIRPYVRLWGEAAKITSPAAVMPSAYPTTPWLQMLLEPAKLVRWSHGSLRSRFLLMQTRSSLAVFPTPRGRSRTTGRRASSDKGKSNPVGGGVNRWAARCNNS